jgi:isopenicillin N synthase-like dioxygenase
MDDLKTRDVRGALRDDEDAIFLMDHPDSDEELPTLDISPYLSGHPGGTEGVAAQLREISKTVGFFYLKGHAIPQNVIESVFAEARRFFNLPAHLKEALPYVATDSFRSGYQDSSARPAQRRNINIISDARPNLLEKFSVNWERAPNGSSTSRTDRSETVNVWPENLPGFKDAVLTYHHAIEKLGRQFLPLWCAALGLPLDYLDRFFEAPHLTMSLLHYPPQKEIGNRQYGIAPHTDNALMTFLAQGDVPGLAVRMPSGHWRAVDAVPGTLLVNTGNLMVRWTNEEYLSTKHRVINKHEIDRYSIPVFFGPSGDAPIEVLPTCQSSERPPRYDPITYRELRDWYYDQG